MDWFARLRGVLGPPRFEGEREAASARLVNSLLWLTIVGAGAFEVFQVFVGVDTKRVGAVGLAFLLAIAARGVLRRRHLGIAAWMATSLVFSIACFSVWLAGHVEAPGTTTFVVLIVISAMVLDWRRAVLWAALSIAALSFFAVAEVRGWMPPRVPDRPVLELWFIYAVHLVAAGWLVAHSAFAFRGALGLLGQRSMELRDSEARNAQLVEQSPDVIVALDERGVITECSPAVESMFGYRVEEIVGRRFSALGVLDADSLAEESQHFREILAGGGRLAEVCVLHRDGGSRWVESNPRVVHQADGSARVYLVIRDITARHEAEVQRAALERELLEARRLEALGRMAGGVAHDFNNLLLVILANAEVLEKEAASARSLVEEIQVAAEGAAELTGQLLAFSGRQVPDVDRVDVRATLAKIDGLLRRLLPPAVSLVVRCQDGIAPARGDPAQLEQVIVNLVMNGHEAMPEGGTVTIELLSAFVSEREREAHPSAAAGEHVRLSVTDTGRGMNEETARHIFEPFYTRRQGGTGLGLATVHGIVTRVGGHIRVRSRLDEGTTFEVYLPVAEGEALAVPVPDRSESPSVEGGVVLLVDDEGAVLSAVSRMLERQGFRVLAADSPEQALSMSRAEPGRIDLLVSDVLMPNQSGTELARALRGERPELKVLLTSGYSPEDLVGDHAVGKGVHFLPKPFSSQRLRERIDEILHA